MYPRSLWPNLRHRHDPWLPAHHITRLEFMQLLVRLSLLKAHSRDVARAQARGQSHDSVISNTSIPVHEAFTHLCTTHIMPHALHVASSDFRIRCGDPAIQNLFVKHQ